MQSSAAVNVDVDSLYLYYRLHDLDESTATNAVWERGVVRFQKLFAELGVHATFFVVSSDLERWPVVRTICEDLQRDGHEIASHSHTHPYDLTRWESDSIAEELERSHQILTAVRGRPVAGFRAPGYTMTQQVYDLLIEKGYTYSSSLFPSPPYYLAKAAVMAKMRLVGKESQAILGHPRWVFNRRLLPHHVGTLKEFPVTVLPWHRVPFIGTSLLMMGSRGYQRLRNQLIRRPFINLEFHGIDLCDLEQDGIDPALLKQPDLKVGLDEKLALFRTVLTDLRDQHGIQTLEALTEPTTP